MTILKSDKVKSKKTAKELFDFLSDFRNFQKLMPAQITNWTATEDTCQFTIQGMATLGMRIISKTPSDKIEIGPDGKVPFQFKLFAFIEDLGAEGSQGWLQMDADLNPLFKMMAEKPLSNFLNMMASKFGEV
jgi:hypothetical protein